MRLIVAVVGKPRNEPLAAAIHDYEERARRKREGERLANAVGGAQVIACDVSGRRVSSPEFAAWVQRLRESASDVAFVIGGAHGLADDLTERAAARVSFSSWTLPHELARLVLAEQLYRAGTIVRGEPYHK